MIRNRRARATLVSLLSAAIFPCVTLGLTTTIDDSGTFVRSPTVQMHWRAISPRQANSTVVNGSTVVQVRLNVAPWLRRTGRIYLVLPAQQPGPIRANWTSQGHLLPGQVTSGDRTLVYSGLISSPYLEDVLQLSITVGGEQLRQAYNLNFRFEMETS